MIDSWLSQPIGVALLVGSAVGGILLAGACLIAVSLGADGRLDEASALGRARETPPTKIDGPSARSLLWRAEVLSILMPLLPLCCVVVALSLTSSGSVQIIAAEAGLAVAVVVMTRSYRAFSSRLERETMAGYSSIDTSPFGDPVRGLWTGVASDHPRPPVPPGQLALPPLDAAISDALGSTLELSPEPDDIHVSQEPPLLLPGTAAATQLRWGWRLAYAGLLPLWFVFLPALAMPLDDTRTTQLMLIVVWFAVLASAGFVVGLSGRRRAFEERAAGYTTLRGSDSSMVSYGVAPDAWQELGTDRLWHLDPETGAVLRPPLDPAVALRDRRVHRPLRRLFGPRSKS